MPTVKEILDYFKVRDEPDDEDDLDAQIKSTGITEEQHIELSRQVHTGVDLDRMRTIRDRRSLYKPITLKSGEDDAVLLFGKHKGHALSKIACEDNGYLVWIQGQDFPSELKLLASYWWNKL